MNEEKLKQILTQLLLNQRVIVEAIESHNHKGNSVEFTTKYVSELGDYDYIFGTAVDSIFEEEGKEEEDSQSSQP